MIGLGADKNKMFENMSLAKLRFLCNRDVLHMKYIVFLWKYLFIKQKNAVFLMMTIFIMGVEKTNGLAVLCGAVSLHPCPHPHPSHNHPFKIHHESRKF